MYVTIKCCNVIVMKWSKSDASTTWSDIRRRRAVQHQRILMAALLVLATAGAVVATTPRPGGVQATTNASPVAKAGRPAKRLNADLGAYLRYTGGIPASSANEPSGNFRTLCTFSHLSYDDPIIYPNQSGVSHLHMFYGNDTANAASTYESLRAAGTSSCEGGLINRSAYWSPVLIDTAGQVVLPDVAIVYYKGTLGNAGDISNIQAMPFGLKMVAGFDMNDPNAKHYWNWFCEDGGDFSATTLNCASGRLAVRLPFPMCWDGVNLDSPNHRSHMAYQKYDNFGRPSCPADHPVQLPEYTISFYWSNAQSAGSWQLSSDTTPGMTHDNGSTFHSDWIGAWDPTIQQAFTTYCINQLLNCVDGELGDGRALTHFIPYSGPVAVPQPKR